MRLVFEPKTQKAPPKRGLLSFFGTAFQTRLEKGDAGASQPFPRLKSFLLAGGVNSISGDEGLEQPTNRTQETSNSKNIRRGVVGGKGIEPSRDLHLHALTGRCVYQFRQPPIRPVRP